MKHLCKWWQSKSEVLCRRLSCRLVMYSCSNSGWLSSCSCYSKDVLWSQLSISIWNVDLLAWRSSKRQLVSRRAPLKRTWAALATLLPWLMNNSSSQEERHEHLKSWKLLLRRKQPRKKVGASVRAKRMYATCRHERKLLRALQDEQLIYEKPPDTIHRV